MGCNYLKKLQDKQINVMSVSVLSYVGVKPRQLDMMETCGNVLDEIWYLYLESVFLSSSIH